MTFDDPRIQVVQLEAGQAAPWRGVLVSDFAWQAILDGLNRKGAE